MTWSVQSGKTLHVVESGMIEKSFVPVEEKPCQTDTLGTRTVILQVGKQTENTVNTCQLTPVFRLRQNHKLIQPKNLISIGKDSVTF
jgi:hypothetical protein